MEAFTAIIFGCWMTATGPTCQHVVWPQILTSEEQCLDTLANGIKALEQRGGKLVGYRCIDWINETDEEV